MTDASRKDLTNVSPRKLTNLSSKELTHSSSTELTNISPKNRIYLFRVLMCFKELTGVI